MINSNLSDYFVKSKYGKVLQTVYINKIMLFIEFQKGGVSTPETLPWVRHWPHSNRKYYMLIETKH